MSTYIFKSNFLKDCFSKLAYYISKIWTDTFKLFKINDTACTFDNSTFKNLFQEIILSLMRSFLFLFFYFNFYGNS